MNVEVTIEGKIPQLEASFTIKATLTDYEEIAKFAEGLRPIMRMIADDIIKTDSTRPPGL